MVKRILTIIAIVLLALLLFSWIFPKPANAVKDWFVGIFTSDNADNNTGDPNKDTTDDSNTQKPDGSQNAGDITGTVTIAGLPAEERLEAILELRNKVLSSENSDHEYTLEEALVLSMRIVVDENGKIVESGHNVPAPKVETYTMDQYPGGWKWKTETLEEGVIKVPFLVCGDKISIFQNRVGVKGYEAADVDNLKIYLCAHDDALLSLSWERRMGDIAIVKFDEDAMNAFKQAFKWWYEINENDEKVIKIGFEYCNEAPEGIDITPVIGSTNVK